MAIDYLKNGKSPGADSIPAELKKTCKPILSPDIAHVLNYIIGAGDFPAAWAEGLRSAVFKSGSRMDTDNYRGITVLPIMEKIFEIIVYHRLNFANEAFHKMAASSMAVGPPIIYLICKVWSNVSCAFETTLSCVLLTSQKRSIWLTAIFRSIRLWKVVGMAQSLIH